MSDRDHRLPARDPQGHKGTFGTVAILGGSHEPSGITMLGGPCLAARAALRTGCGLVRLVLPRPILLAGLTIVPEATGRALEPKAIGDLIDEQQGRPLALVVGPGLGTGKEADAVVRAALDQTSTPIVLDADALNILSRDPNVLEAGGRPPLVLTPHVGEFRRLAAAYSLDVDADQSGAAALAETCRAVVVLKSAATIIASPGAAQALAIDRPNPALATGGTGDVLAGVIASLLAQHGSDIAHHELAAAAVHVHADAAEAWTRAARARGGMLAGDLVEHLPAAAQSRRAE